MSWLPIVVKKAFFEAPPCGQALPGRAHVLEPATVVAPHRAVISLRAAASGLGVIDVTEADDEGRVPRGDQAGGHVGFVLVPAPKSPMTAKDTSATVGVGVLALGALVVGSVLAVGAGLSAALQFRREPKSANPVTTRTMVAAISAMVSREGPGARCTRPW